MTRLVLLSVLCLCTWIYFPESRAILVETTEPLVDPVVERVMRPFTSWGALDEMRRVGRNVVALMGPTGSPTRRTISRSPRRGGDPAGSCRACVVKAKSATLTGTRPH